jgi:hypothetical protein
MSKKKSKKKNKAQKKQKQGNPNINTKRVGAAVAGVLVSELVNAAVQRLSEKALKADDAETDNEFKNDRSNPLQTVVSKMGDRVEEIEASAGDTVDVARSSVNNLTVNLSDVIDVLQDTGEQLKDRSANIISHSSGAILENVSSGAIAVLDRVMPDTDKASKKSKKNKKKK